MGTEKWGHRKQAQRGEVMKSWGHKEVESVTGGGVEMRGNKR